MTKKTRIALVLALVVVLAVATVGSTIAWLTDKTDPVTNTFSASDIKITLTEVNGGPYQVIPGKEYEKDPVVAVDGEKTNVDVYLFVKFEEIGNPAIYFTYASTLTSDNGWEQVEGQSNVWWREVKADDTVKSWHLLDGDKITVKSEGVTVNNMTAAAAAKLNYTAYAIQSDYTGTAAEAWAKLNP